MRTAGPEVVVYEDAASLEEGLPQLARQEGVALVQPNYTYTSTALSTTDPLLAEQWALYNDGSFQLEEQENPYPVFNDPFALPSAPWQWIAPWWMQSDASAGSTGTVQAAAGVDIGAEDAWALYDGGSRDVVVALVDTGIDYTHADLEGRIWVNEDEIPGNGVDDDGNGYIDDVYGWNFYSGSNQVYTGSEDSHGTHGAGHHRRPCGQRHRDRRHRPERPRQSHGSQGSGRVGRQRLHGVHHPGHSVRGGQRSPDLQPEPGLFQKRPRAVPHHRGVGYAVRSCSRQRRAPTWSLPPATRPATTWITSLPWRTSDTTETWILPPATVPPLWTWPPRHPYFKHHPREFIQLHDRNLHGGAYGQCCGGHALLPVSGSHAGRREGHPAILRPKAGQPHRLTATGGMLDLGAAMASGAAAQKGGPGRSRTWRPIPTVRPFSPCLSSSGGGSSI